MNFLVECSKMHIQTVQNQSYGAFVSRVVAFIIEVILSPNGKDYLAYLFLLVT